MKRTYAVVLAGLLISMEIVLTRFLSYESQFLRIGFGFLPIAVSAMIFGSVGSGSICALSDLLGVMIVLKGPFHAGLTVCAFLSGLIYGLFFYKKPRSVLRVLFAVLTINLLVDIGLKTYWLSALYNTEYLAILGQRAIKSIVMVPIQTGVIYYTWRYLGGFIESSVIPKISFVKSTQS